MNGTEKQNETSMEIPAEDSRVTMGNQTEKKHRFHLKMPQKGRKHSVKKRIAYTFIATMAATLLIIGLINYFFLGSFYIRDKEHILAESFQKLNATGGDSDDIPDTFEQFCVTNNLKVIITGPELSSFVYSNATDRQSLQTLIFGLISGNEQANTKVVDSKDNYQIQKFYDSHADAEYLQIIGWVDNGKMPAGEHHGCGRPFQPVLPLYRHSDHHHRCHCDLDHHPPDRPSGAGADRNFEKNGSP